MRRIRGETPTEEIFLRTFKNYDLYLKHETPTSPRWEWVIMDGNVPVAFDDEATFTEAEMSLARAALAEVPGFASVIEDSPVVVADEEADFLDFLSGGFVADKGTSGGGCGDDDAIPSHVEHPGVQAATRTELLVRARGLLRLVGLTLVAEARERLGHLESKLTGGQGSPLAGVAHESFSQAKVDTVLSTSAREVPSTPKKQSPAHEPNKE